MQMLHELNAENSLYNHAYDVIKLNSYTIATAHDDGIRIWDFMEGKFLQHLHVAVVSKNYDTNAEKVKAEARQRRVKKIAKTGDDKLAAIYSDGHVRIWNTQNATCEQELSNKDHHIIYENRAKVA